MTDGRLTIRQAEGLKGPTRAREIGAHLGRDGYTATALGALAVAYGIGASPVLDGSGAFRALALAACSVAVPLAIFLFRSRTMRVAELSLMPEGGPGVPRPEPRPEPKPDPWPEPRPEPRPEPSQTSA